MPQPLPVCATSSRENAETIFATAPRVKAWLLIEYTGTWTRELVRAPDFPANIRAFAKRFTKKVRRSRVLLIRGDPEPKRRVILALTGEGSLDTGEWEEPVHYQVQADPEYSRELADSLVALANGTVDDADSGLSVEPLFLVCTDAGHDPCCGHHGVAVWQALKAAWPGQVWQCSHVGGDRYAANVVCLPRGLYFGRVTEGKVEQLISTCRSGTLDLGMYRGCSAHSFAVQAAEHFVREQTGLVRYSDLDLADERDLGQGTFEVTLERPGVARYVATVKLEDSEFRVRMSCAASKEQCVRKYHLLSCTTVPLAPGA